MSGKLRVLPLGGLGEIGKNMTVVEYDGRIVVVDTGLMFPTGDMLGVVSARMRLPLVDADEQQRDAIRSVLERNGNLTTSDR